jgi:hypothetical protein
VEPFIVSQELEFRQEAIKRTLQELYDDDDLDGLMDAALLLNMLWHQQTAIARWFAKEAAENLGEAWQASRSHV